MTFDSEAVALEILNEIAKERNTGQLQRIERTTFNTQEALCRSIEAHYRFKQEVSDALWRRGYQTDDPDFGIFIIDKPNRLVEALTDCFGQQSCESEADRLITSIAAYGGKIVWDE